MNALFAFITGLLRGTSVRARLASAVKATPKFRYGSVPLQAVADSDSHVNETRVEALPLATCFWASEGRVLPPCAKIPFAGSLSWSLTRPCFLLELQNLPSFPSVPVPAIRHVLFPVLIVMLMSGNAAFLRGQISDSRIQVLTEKAQAAQRSEDTEEAIRAYEEILRIRPHWAPAELNLGVMYHLKKRYLDAIRIL